MAQNIPRRRQKFAAEYVKNGFNGVQAVLAAGYKMGYDAACVEASRLLRNPKVKKHVEEHLQKAKMSADEVLEELSSVARSDAKIGGSEKLKALELLGKGHKLFTDRTETISETSTTNLSKIISAAAKREAKDPQEVEFALQVQFSDKSQEDYDPALDPSVNPQVWPSGLIKRSEPLEAPEANN